MPIKKPMTFNGNQTPVVKNKGLASQEGVSSFTDAVDPWRKWTGGSTPSPDPAKKTRTTMK